MNRFTALLTIGLASVSLQTYGFGGPDFGFVDVHSYIIRSGVDHQPQQASESASAVDQPQTENMISPTNVEKILLDAVQEAQTLVEQRCGNALFKPLEERSYDCNLAVRKALEAEKTKSWYELDFLYRGKNLTRYEQSRDMAKKLVAEHNQELITVLQQQKAAKALEEIEKRKVAETEGENSPLQQIQEKLDAQLTDADLK